MFSMVADLLLIVSLLALLFSISVGSYIFLNYCCPDVQLISESERQRMLMVTNGRVMPGMSMMGAMMPLPPPPPPPTEPPPEQAMELPATRRPRVMTGTVGTNTPLISHKCNGGQANTVILEYIDDVQKTEEPAEKATSPVGKTATTPTSKKQVESDLSSEELCLLLPTEQSEQGAKRGKQSILQQQGSSLPPPKQLPMPPKQPPPPPKQPPQPPKQPPLPPAATESVPREVIHLNHKSPHPPLPSNNHDGEAQPHKRKSLSPPPPPPAQALEISSSSSKVAKTDNGSGGGTNGGTNGKSDNCLDNGILSGTLVETTL